MSELAHGAMLVGALAGAACAVAGRRTTLELVASTAMLAAMVDMAFARLVAPIGWTAVLAGLGILLGARLRGSRCTAGAAVAPGHRRHALHRALAFVVGAWAFAAMPGDGTGAATGAGHVHLDPLGGGLAFIAATAATTAFGAWVVVAELRAGHAARDHRSPRGARRIRHAAEAASTTVMLAAMAVPGVVAALV